MNVRLLDVCVWSVLPWCLDNPAEGISPSSIYEATRIPTPHPSPSQLTTQTRNEHSRTKPREKMKSLYYTQNANITPVAQARLDSPTQAHLITSIYPHSPSTY